MLTDGLMKAMQLWFIVLKVCFRLKIPSKWLFFLFKNLSLGEFIKMKNKNTIQ